MKLLRNNIFIWWVFGLFLTGIVCASGLLMCGCVSGDREKKSAPPAKQDYSVQAREWADSVADTMSIEEMAAQLIVPALYSDSTSLCSVSFYADSLRTGGVILLKGTLDGAKNLVDSLSRSFRIPPFIMIDAEWGLGMRLTDAQVFPRNGLLPDYVDDQNMYDYGRELARQASGIGINMVLGPVLDVNPSDGVGIMGTRAFKGNASRVASLGVAFAKGLEDGGVLSVAKHFPGHGGIFEDSHNTLPVIGRTLTQLHESDLLPFREYISQNLSCIMVGHLAVPALDSLKRSAAVSESVISGLLRNEMGFSGLIMTDALNMRGVSGSRHPSLEAVLAGADMLLAPKDTRESIREIASGCRRGIISREELREHCVRILFFKYRFAVR